MKKGVNLKKTVSCTFQNQNLVDLGGVGGGRRGGGGKKLKGGEGKIGEGVGEEEQEGKRRGEEGGLDAYKEEVEEKRGAGRKGSLGLSMARPKP